MPVFYSLETARLVLRPFEDRDIEPFHLYRSDPEVARYQGWESPFPLEQAVRFVDEMKARSPGKPGGVVPACAVAQKYRGNDRGLRLSPPGRRTLPRPRSGLPCRGPTRAAGTRAEAVTRLIDTLFGDLGLHRVLANCDPENTASSRLLQRVGMRHEGRFLESLWYKGRSCGRGRYALLRREWEERRRPGK